MTCAHANSNVERPKGADLTTTKEGTGNLRSHLWEHIELEAWERFSRLEIDPENPDGCLSPDDWRDNKDLRSSWKELYVMYLQETHIFYMQYPALQNNPFDEYMEFMCTYY